MARPRIIEMIDEPYSKTLKRDFLPLNEPGAQLRGTRRRRLLRHLRLMPGGYHGPIGPHWRDRDQSAKALNHTVKRVIYL